MILFRILVYYNIFNITELKKLTHFIFLIILIFMRIFLHPNAITFLRYIKKFMSQQQYSLGKAMKKSILFTFIIFCFFLNRVYSQTYWGNNITTDTTWTLSMSPIILTNSISVLDSATLTIQDSVQVNLANGSITVNIFRG